jgi:cytochrome c peroxidase
VRAAIMAALLVAPCALAACGAREFPPPVPLGLDLYTRVPADNTLTAERVELGRALFFDSSLSASGTVSCSSCHRPEHAFSDTLSVSPGVYGRTGSRNAPSLFNVTYRERLFWDGRSSRIEEQVLLPLQSATEMDRSLDDLVARLSANTTYQRAFRRAFDDDITADNVARALASFVRTLRSGNSAFDRFRSGDSTALSPSARRGLDVFTGRGCVGCHGGPNLSEGAFHNTGVAVDPQAPVATVNAAGPGPVIRDMGRYAVTMDESDRGAFRTASLRNVSLTAPYMHDGSLRTLEDVIDFYDGGGRPNPRLDPRIRPLGLTEREKSDLLAFLRSLEGEG